MELQIHKGGSSWIHVYCVSAEQDKEELYTNFTVEG